MGTRNPQPLCYELGCFFFEGYELGCLDDSIGEDVMGFLVNLERETEHERQRETER